MEPTNQLKYDPRFYKSGLVANDYNIQSFNGVLKLFTDQQNSEARLPKHENKVGWQVYSWNRPTIQWSLECED